MIKAEQIKVLIRPAPAGEPVVIPRQSPVDTPMPPAIIVPTMAGDSTGSSNQQWAIFKKWGCRGTDFDWFALDKFGHLGVFTTARQGPVPLPIWEDQGRFERLRAWVGALPPLAPAVQVYPGPGNYRDWSEYALKGLFAFDYQNDPGGAIPEGYTLIAQPTATLTTRESAVAAAADWLPRLDVDFSSGKAVSTAFILPFGMHE